MTFGNTVAWLLGSALLLVFLITPFLWPLRWFAVVLLACMPGWPQDTMTALVRERVIPVWNEWPLTVAALTLALGARVLTHGLLRDGNEKHVKAYRMTRYLRLATMPDANGHQASLHHWGTVGSAVLDVAQFPLRRYMRLLLRQPQATPAHAMARAELVFGSDMHWVLQASVALGALLLVAAGCLFATWFWGSQWVVKASPAALVLCELMLLLAMLPTMSWQSALLRSKREQSLLMLLPGMPRGAPLNRWLARRVLLQSLIGWVLAAGIASQLHFAPGDETFVVAGYLASLSMIPFLIQDWSRTQVPRPAQVSAYLAAFALGSALCYGAQSWLHWTPAAALAACVLFTALMLFWRWRRMADYPSAFPAGRFAPV